LILIGRQSLEPHAFILESSLSLYNKKE